MRRTTTFRSTIALSLLGIALTSACNVNPLFADSEVDLPIAATPGPVSTPIETCPIEEEPTNTELDEVLGISGEPILTLEGAGSGNGVGGGQPPPAETYKYVGPTTDFTGVPLIYEKVYQGNVCVKTKKFYYCAPCSDLNDEHPTIWVDPATAKFLFEPPYLLGQERTLKEVNYLQVEMGSGSRNVTDLDPDETNPNIPLAPGAQQRQTVVTSTVIGGTLIRNFTLEAP